MSPDPVTRADVADAQDRTAGRVRHTPPFRASLATVSGPIEVVFKQEYLQLGGCFKARGSLNAVLHAADNGQLDDAGILVASGGNAAIGAAWAGRIAGCRCTVVVPETAPAVKVESLRALGADVHLIGRRYQDAADAATQMAERSGALALHAYDLPDIVAGAGTIGLELAEDVDGPLTTVVCVGGGGLLGGMTAAMRAGDRMVGVEPIGASCLRSALDAGRPVPVELDSVAADSLGATRLGDICWATIADREVTSVTVSDADLIAARQLLWTDYRILVEHGTASAVAAVCTGKVRAAPGTTLCVVLCGANTPLTLDS
ncbi:pyridoxal-phosphate dependent enzyme [Gordonia sp. HNM0687]|uniref:Pyridoxal-phosphate dependent enzyme n=1 Tax=Gordonia mangrovi TaxID=2665643 RepID=A0A6L7GSS7_9ACTN|nr:serine/threonine dehydratase [Gordonia mangrovi]MXP23064.1 pyridoxal-phosphate dependent enzyme [Gordonia mangrovi]UVF77353.1 serine/threonine dehydratase [Gordonia mangrovi]